jgi:hypothetical protein
MPTKKLPPDAPSTARKTPRARKKPPAETQPIEPESQTLAQETQRMPMRSAPGWFTPAAIGLAVALLLGILLEINRPLDLAAAQDRLSRMEAVVDAGAGGSTLQARLASAERVARLCRDGLQSMVRMWNRYVQELKASEASRSRYRAASRRFDTAQKHASLAVRRCEDA